MGGKSRKSGGVSRALIDRIRNQTPNSGKGRSRAAGSTKPKSKGLLEQLEDQEDRTELLDDA